MLSPDFGEMKWTNMKNINFSIVLSFVLLTACHISPDDSPEIHTEKWIINSHGVGNIELGKSIDEIKTKVITEFDILDAKFGGFDIIENDEVLIKVSPIAGKVAVIDIYSDNFESKNGLKVGLTIEEIERTDETFLAQMDEMNGRVFYAPDELQSSNFATFVYFTTPDDSPVWKFEKKINGTNFKYEPKGEINKKATVELIRINTK